MKTYTVFFRRRKDSPISYLTGANEFRAKNNYVAIEKEHFGYREKSIQMPVIKGSHFRGRFRQFVVEKILEYRAKEIEEYDEKLKSAVMKLISVAYLIGNVQVNETKPTYGALTELLSADPFFKYFGYMVSSLPTVRSLLSMGFAVPLVKGVIDDSLIEKAEELSLSVVDAEEIKVVALNLGTDTVHVPYPLVNVETYRIVEKLGKVEKIGTLINAGNTEEVKELISSYVKQGKEDVKNILFSEVFSPVCDLVQKISFADDEEEMHKGILTAYRMLFEREPFIGGKISAGYGFVEEVVIFDERGNRIEKDENALKSFVKSIDFEKATSVIVPAKKKKK